MERHGLRVWRVAVDGGFSCPNRSLGGRGPGGCAYCSPAAGRSPYLEPLFRSAAAEKGIHCRAASVGAQIDSAMAFLSRRYGARAFFLYFQAFSSTNAPVEVLRSVYDEALSKAEFRGLVVSTRPDCVDEDKAELLRSYADRGLEVWVELGLQSALERSLVRIGRGHGVEAFLFARRLLAERGIRTAVHLILGLPGESRADMLEGPRLLAELGLEGVKFHDLRVVRGARLAAEYLSGEVVPLHPSRLPSLLADCIELLPPGCEVMRLCSDFPSGECLAPKRLPEKGALYRAVEAELESRGTRQGLRCAL
jgi:radical SAM protein (TIGR01212 family)